MGFIRAGEKPHFVTLPANRVLRVAADAQSSGVVWQYPDSVGGQPSSRTAIGAGEGKTFGPVQDSLRLSIECAAGSITFTDFVDQGDAGIPAVGTVISNPVYSDGKLASYDLPLGWRVTITYANGKIATQSYTKAGETTRVTTWVWNGDLFVSAITS